MKPQAAARERRTAPRIPASGRIEFSFADPTAVRIEGEMIESSGNGFRVSYSDRALSPGQEVSFQRGKTVGKARVIWTQVLGERNLSGFLLL